MLRTDYAVRMLQMLAGFCALALMMSSVGLGNMFTNVAAANVTDASDTLSDSAPSAVSNHTIRFITSNGMAAGETIQITYASFTGGDNITIDDIDLATTSDPNFGSLVDETLATSQGAATWGVSTSTNSLTLQAPSGYGVPSSTAIEIQIGSNATGGTSRLINPSATGSAEIVIGGTMPDSGETLVFIIENVTVTASVDTNFQFTVSGVAAGENVNTSGTTTATATTPTALPFEEVAPDVSKTLAHDLQVITNADNGFVVTVQQSGELASVTGADINSFASGSYLDTPGPWVAPTAQIANDETWGHWGITSEDLDLDSQGIDFTADTWVAASNTPRAIFAHDNVADGTTVGEGTARVGYQIQVSSLQEAANDYTTTLTYVATPVF